MVLSRATERRSPSHLAGLGLLVALAFVWTSLVPADADANPRRTGRAWTMQRVRDAMSEANPFPGLTRRIQGMFSRGPSGSVGAGEHPRMLFAERAPSQRSQRVFKQKPILVAGTAQIDRYLKSVKDDSIEVIFMPHTVGGAADTGHVAVRVGDRKFDMTTMGTRNQPFSQSREGYGFVFEVGPERVKQIEAAYEELIRKQPRFSMTGLGEDNCYSCAGFITQVLDTVAGDLGVQPSMSAIGTAKQLVAGRSHVAVTLYGAAADQAKNEDYVFAKIEN